MAGQPKKKISHANQGMRRSHLALAAVGLGPCPQCRALIRPHQACPKCGTFRGRQVIRIRSKRQAGTA